MSFIYCDVHEGHHEVAGLFVFNHFFTCIFFFLYMSAVCLLLFGCCFADWHPVFYYLCFSEHPFLWSCMLFCIFDFFFFFHVQLGRCVPCTPCTVFYMHAYLHYFLCCVFRFVFFFFIDFSVFMFLACFFARVHTVLWFTFGQLRPLCHRNSYQPARVL